MIPDLRSKAPEFISSNYFRRLDEKSAVLTGIVCAAFTRFICDMIDGGADEAKTKKYFDIIENWVASGDDSVQNWVVVEMFEVADVPTRGLQEFKDRLGAKSRELWEEWLEYPPEDRLSR